MRSCTLLDSTQAHISCAPNPHFGVFPNTPLPKARSHTRAFLASGVTPGSSIAIRVADPRCLLHFPGCLGKGAASGHVGGLLATLRVWARLLLSIGGLGLSTHGAAATSPRMKSFYLARPVLRCLGEACLGSTSPAGDTSLPPAFLQDGGDSSGRGAIHPGERS
jgi:hypothetical protein